MERGDRVPHVSSFGAAAAAYAEHRPDCPQAAVRWALEPAAGGILAGPWRRRLLPGERTALAYPNPLT